MHTPDQNLRIAGVDEAGRGPLAGPVSIAAVILDPCHPIDGLADSKKLTERRRERLYQAIITHAMAYKIIHIHRPDIDRLNILQATMQGMLRAIAGLNPAADKALVDGNRLPENLPCPTQAIIRGDQLHPVISAASILAKVSRDRYMIDLEQTWPGYGFAKHKGYGVAQHLKALQQLGPCPEHRRSFAPVRKCLNRWQEH